MRETGIGALADAPAGEALDARDPARIDEEFALLMTTCAQIVRPPAPGAMPEASAAGTAGAGAAGLARAAEIWRRADGPVTGRANVAANATGETGTSTAPTTQARFVTQVVHKELGAMEITVERKDDSVRVVFEVTDAVARVAVETQRNELLASLHAAGVQVASVVVSVRAGGIALAPKAAPARTRRANIETPFEPGEPGDSGGKSGLNLVG
jgi:hypothetical protein